ncbi:MAG: hypothetical protein ACTSO7_02445 [Candidatus Heimdallarchaeota archaeon]
MTQKTENASMSHIKVKKWEKENVLTKIIEKQAYSVDTAMSQEEMQLEKNEEIALQRIVEDGLLVEILKEEVQYYYLREDLKPKKNYRKAVVKGLSIPILIFMITIIIAGIGTILYQLLVGF